MTDVVGFAFSIDGCGARGDGFELKIDECRRIHGFAHFLFSGVVPFSALQEVVAGGRGSQLNPETP